MKVSLNWMAEYLDFELPPIDILIEKIGAQLGSIDEVIDIGARYKGVVIVKIIDCQTIENSDHLNLCKIDDGGQTGGDIKRDENGYVQVVCGAPNVRAGITVAWLPPGVVVPSTYGKDPFVLEARELRGILSNGMLASPKELAIGDSHEGLLILANEQQDKLEKTGNYWDDLELKPGADFASAYRLDDYVIDIENKMFTHRPDLFGQLGVAREIAGILGHLFSSPKIYSEKSPNVDTSESQRLTVINELPELVPRFVAQVFKDISIAPSPVWLQSYLSRVGIRPINNVVDLTNYFMVLTGQPFHAYDYDKVADQNPDSDGATLIVRYPHADEKIQLLNGKEVKPRSEAIMIATPTKAIGLGGVMGGADTEVDDKTTAIILECATFDMYSIRRTSMAQGIFSDAVTRFNKGQSPLQNDRITVWASEALTKYAGATGHDKVEINSLPATVIERDSLYTPVTVESSFINERLGLDVSSQDMVTLLCNVEFNIRTEGDKLIVNAPFWRTDIELREDVVEEVGRLYSFDRLPLKLPYRDITPAHKEQLLELKRRTRTVLASAGANELLTYSFVHGDLLRKVGQDSKAAFKLSNALSPDLQYFRLSLTPSLIEKIHMNIKAGYDHFALFEIGKAHSKDALTDGVSLPHEFERVALVFAADKKAAVDFSGAAYYQAKNYLMYLLDELGLTSRLKFVPLDAQNYESNQLQFIAPYEANRSATVMFDEKVIGEVGEYKSSVRKSLKLPELSAGFELDLEMIGKMMTSQKPYVMLPKYPAVTQDICLKVQSNLHYQELYDLIWAELGSLRPEHTHIMLSPVDIYQRDDDQEHKQITYRLVIASYEKTMTDDEVNELLDAVSEKAREKLGAERI